MGLQKQITTDTIQALKAGESDRVSVLRMLSAAIQVLQIEQRGKEESGELTEEEVLSAVQKEAKKRMDAVEAFEKGGREDLALKEKEELEIIQNYLPEQLDENKIRLEVKDVIVEIGASSQSDFGLVMSGVMDRVKGRADGKIVSSIVREELNS